MFNRQTLALIIFSLAITFLNSRAAYAVHMYNEAAVSNSYLFIENNVDNEYFLTSSSLDPRFTGANTWTRYKTNQDSMGYMGVVGWHKTNTWVDMWIDNSPINGPLMGLRCRLQNGGTCPSTGYLEAGARDNSGFYHARAGNSLYNGSYGFASFSPAAYNYFKDQPVGTQDSFDLNYCYSDTDYDYAAGERCNTLSTGYWHKRIFNVTKLGHLRLQSTGALAEVWIASDGTPSVNIGSEYCQVGVVSNVRGLICKMAAYSLQETQKINSLNFKMIIDNSKLGFSPYASDVKYSGDASKWYNFNTTTAYSNVFTTGGDYVYAFISDSFFQKMVKAGTSISANDNIFTLNFNNTNTPESGYYQFTTSTTLNIVPKEYGISIVSADEKANPKQSGKIDSDKPIEFEYRITTSAPRQADSITVQVVGESATIQRIPYCVFTSADETLKVPVPAYISFTSNTGATITKRNSCSDAPINITRANWVQTAWNANLDDSFYYRANIKLIFPMNDSRSQFTLSGQDWMGTVSASGEIKATATWVGVDRSS
ncbi:hypothetical protein J5S76_10415 [Bacillus amyloliquefaciens]|uniref:fimbrial protein n=1 Tax=Leclercia sp. W6 TaxID=2282310 RepID=UPI00143DB09E|nr:fimbrial protein [Leclercia sp. W6]MCG1032391.1 hypothetical protein [Bacillus amyloliquefaciens]